MKMLVRIPFAKILSLSLLSIFALQVASPACAGSTAPISVSEKETVLITNAVDPEFLDEESLVTFQDTKNQIWLSKINNTSGLLDSATAKVIGKAVSINQSLNGPEFGVSKQGFGVYYTGVGSNGVNQIFRFKDGKTTQITNSSKKFQGLIPTRNATDPAVCFLTGKFPAAIALCEDNPGKEIKIPYDVLGDNFLRWISGERAVLTSLKDQNGVVQIARFDIDTGKTTFLTTDAGEKINPFVFTAPEFNNEKLLMCVVAKKQLGIYRNVNGQWQRIYTLNTQSPGGEITSPEPFTFGGKTYIVSAIARPKKSDNQPTGLIDPIEAAVNIGAVVYVSSLDGKTVIPVSNTTTIGRFDPESFVKSNTAFIYYNSSSTVYKTKLMLTP